MQYFFRMSMTFRRLIASVLTLALFLAFQPAAHAAMLSLPANMNDVLATLKAEKIIGSSDYFRAQEPLFRSEALTMVFRAVNAEPEVPKNLPSVWQDVPTSAWYAYYVKLGTELGVLRQQENKLFHPDSAVTKAEFLTMLYRYNALVTGKDTWLPGTARYKDIHPADWYYTSILWARGQFLWALDGDFALTAFHPEQTLSREEAAKLIYLFRMSKKLNGYDVAPLGTPQSSVSQKPEGIAYTTQFTGEALKDLPPESYIYKKVMPASLGSDTLPIPGSVYATLPGLGKQGVMQFLNITSQDVPSLTLNFDAKSHEVHVYWNRLSTEQVLRTGTTQDLWVKAADRIMQHLGVDTRYYEEPEIVQQKDTTDVMVAYPQHIDGLPLYNLDGTKYHSLSVSFSTGTAEQYVVNLDMKLASVRGIYSLLSWDDVLKTLQEIQTADTELEVFPSPLSRVETTYTSAKQIMAVSPVTVDREQTEMVIPAILFEGKRVGYTHEGQEIDLGNFSKVVPRLLTPPAQE